MRAARGIALVFVLALTTGCSGAPAGSGAPSGSSTPASAAVVASEPVSAAPGDAISSEAVAYAKRLGGTSHKGETLHFVIVTSDPSEAVVASRYEESVPHFGDVADYFVILDSDWFPELVPGEFVLAEAHSTAANASEAADWWRGRVDATWYQAVVEKVTVHTDSPIPVVYVDVETGE